MDRARAARAHALADDNETRSQDARCAAVPWGMGGWTNDRCHGNAVCATCHFFVFSTRGALHRDNRMIALARLLAMSTLLAMATFVGASAASMLPRIADEPSGEASSEEVVCTQRADRCNAPRVL